MRDRLKHVDGELHAILEALRRYCLICSELETLRMALRECVQHKVDIAGSALARTDDGLPRAKGGHSDPTLRAVELIMEQCREREMYLLDSIRELMDERNMVERLLMHLDPVEQKIVRSRWIQRKDWVNIAFLVELSDRQCQRIHRKALCKMSARMREWEAENTALQDRKKNSVNILGMSLHVG